MIYRVEELADGYDEDSIAVGLDDGTLAIRSNESYKYADDEFVTDGDGRTVARLVFHKDDCYQSNWMTY
jgi:hypothetical protein